MSSLVLVDGSGFIFRAFHSLPPLTRKDGTPVGAVYGFVNMLMKLREQMQDVSHMAVIFDAGRVTFRNRLYAEYKAHRPPAPEELVPQFPLVREATRAMNLPCVELEDYEADDIIATYARQAERKGFSVKIISSDKDLMQLINKKTHMFDAMKNKDIGPEQVVEKFGVGPEKVIEVQALIGDSSDNIPGVPGIGPKTAAQLIEEYGDLETLLERAAEIKQNKRRENIIEHAELARLSKQLVTLKEDCEGLPELEAFVLKDLEAAQLAGFLHAQEFTSLYQRLASKYALSEEDVPVASVSPAAEVARDYELVQTAEALQRWVEQIRSAGHVAFDVETDSLEARTATLVGFSLSVEPGKACYVPLNHTELKAQQAGQGDLFGGQEQSEIAVRRPDQLEECQALEIIRPVLEEEAILKIGQNIKFDLLVMQAHGVDISPIEDTMLLSYCQSAGLHAQNMDELSQRHLEITPVPFKEMVGTGKSQVTFDRVEPDKACGYAAEDADITLRLWQLLKPSLVTQRLTSVYERLERPLVPVITRMEYHGIRVDEAHLEGLSQEFGAEIASLEQEIHGLAGRAFTIGSPKQLGEVLFDEMGMKAGKKSSKTGAYSTSVEILEELAAEGHLLPAKVLEWRQLSKLKSTYTDALLGQVNPQTGRVHTSFSLAVTSTGRLSSSDPNLQNIPVRTEQGKRIRKAFIAGEGYQLLSADYSQIELRLLAHIAEIEPLREAFKAGADIHATTASQMFGVPVDQVDGDLRRRAKTINFGIIYGISAHGLATRLGIGRKEAADYIEAYFGQYPGIRRYMERTKEQARAQGYVETLWGRRCHVPGINDKNGNRRAFSERAAINAPLQGSAADIIKRAMIRVDALLHEGGYQSRMLLQVHDELLFEIAEGEEERLVPLIAKAMEQAASLAVPLIVESGLGRHWGEIH